MGAENILYFAAFPILDALSVLLKDFVGRRQEQIPVELPMEAPRSHPQDSACEFLHTEDAGPEGFVLFCFSPWWT